MNLKFYKKVNLKKETLNKVFFIIKYKEFYLFSKKIDNFVFFNIDFDETEGISNFFIEKLRDFGNYKLDFISYFKLDDNFSSIYLLEINENNLFISDNFDFFEILPKSNIFENKVFYEKIIKKFITNYKSYYIYILRCKNSTLYTGITTDFNKRYAEHQSGTGAKYTKNKGPFILKSLFTIKGRSEASKVEAFIKKLSKEKKEKLLIDNTSLLEVFPNLIFINN